MPTKTPEKTAKAKAGGGKQSALQKPLQPSNELAAVIGPGAVPRGEVVSKVWEYIKSHKLQILRTAAKSWLTTSSRRCSARKATMFEMNKHLAQHLK